MAAGSDLTLEHFDGNRWAALKTVHGIGCENPFDASSSTLGLFALIGQGGSSGSSPWTIALLVFLCLIVVLGAALTTIRRQRGRRARF